MHRAPVSLGQRLASHPQSAAAAPACQPTQQRQDTHDMVSKPRLPCAHADNCMTHYCYLFRYLVPKGRTVPTTMVRTNPSNGNHTTPSPCRFLCKHSFPLLPRTASGANQNCGNVLTDRSTTRIHAPPGGQSSIKFY